MWYAALLSAACQLFLLSSNVCYEPVGSHSIRCLLGGKIFLSMKQGEEQRYPGEERMGAREYLHKPQPILRVFNH